jgi:hypothetical protein
METFIETIGGLKTIIVWVIGSFIVSFLCGLVSKKGKMLIAVIMKLLCNGILGFILYKWSGWVLWIWLSLGWVIINSIAGAVRGASAYIKSQKV